MKNKNKLIMYCFVCILTVLSGCGSSGGSKNDTNNQTVSPDIDIPPEVIVMLGDSLTSGGHWAEDFNRPDIVNAGIGGDTISKLINRLDSILDAKPKAIFLMIGINDLLSGGRTPDYVRNNTERIILRLQEKSPSTIIFIQSLLPQSRVPGHDEDIIETNTKLKALCDTLELTYVDLYPLFLNRPDAYKTDKVHLIQAGYTIWEDAIRQYISTL
ncbi:MAG: GDSL-type esterase/lipase family protein [Bacteroidota bacterium]|nr:GDSL-type esterase/lipase family protein [Bacteroidota bacterium]